MDNFLEKAKDILYHFFDYIFIGLVLIILGLIINWRLAMMFDRNKQTSDKQMTSPSQIEYDEDKNDIKDADKSQTNEIPARIIDITIPKGSVSSDIGLILEEANLIDDYEDFEKKVYELDLASSLKPGDFKFELGTSLEDIVKEISK